MNKTKPRKTNHWVGRNKGHTINVPYRIYPSRLPIKKQLTYVIYVIYTHKNRFHVARVYKDYDDDKFPVAILTVNSLAEMKVLLNKGILKHKYDVNGMMKYICHVCNYNVDYVTMTLHIVKI